MTNQYLCASSPPFPPPLPCPSSSHALRLKNRLPSLLNAVVFPFSSKNTCKHSFGTSSASAHVSRRAAKPFAESLCSRNHVVCLPIMRKGGKKIGRVFAVAEALAARARSFPGRMSQYVAFGGSSTFRVEGAAKSLDDLKAQEGLPAVLRVW